MSVTQRADRALKQFHIFGKGRYYTYFKCWTSPISRANSNVNCPFVKTIIYIGPFVVTVLMLLIMGEAVYA